MLIRHRFREVPVFTVHTKTRKRRFRKFHSGKRFQKFVIAVYIEYVWTEDVSAKNKLRFQRERIRVDET